VQALDAYVPRPGLSVPVVTVLDTNGRVLEDQQRRVVRFAIQDGAGADIIFAAGTTGEWDRMDNPRRQLVGRVVVEECRARAGSGRKIEAWVGVTAPSRVQTLENLVHALEIEADAAVVAPLSIADVGDLVTFIEREIAEVFQKRAKMMPVFLYDNADIAAPGKAPHLHTRDVKRLSRLDYVRGIKVTASKTVLGNYMRAASHFNERHEFAIYAGNPYLIFDLFASPDGVAAFMKHYWNRYWTRGALPYGVVAGAANALAREWRRGWQVCLERRRDLMERYGRILAEFRVACSFGRPGREYRPTIACLKAALAELGVIESEAVGAGTPTLEEEERREFARRFAELRKQAADVLEPQSLSRYDAGGAGRPGAQQAAG
jgi:dihydrodipicolinate synthase/N-acetylneuraminate lyase